MDLLLSACQIASNWSWLREAVGLLLAFAIGGERRRARQFSGLERVAELPRWAQVALLARCARRAEPLFWATWPSSPPSARSALAAAIDHAEHAAASALEDVFARKAGDDAAAVAAAAEDAKASYAAAAARAAAAALYSLEDLNSVRYSGSAADAYLSRTATSSAERHHMQHVFAEAAIQNAERRVIERLADSRDAFRNIPGFPEALARDLELLSAVAKQQGWTYRTPVPPGVFGPLWPNGEPEGWPTAGGDR